MSIAYQLHERVRQIEGLEKADVVLVELIMCKKVLNNFAQH
jgi:hypothetical protein